MSSGQKGLRKGDAEKMYKMTEGCPCDKCDKRSFCKQECKTFQAWANELTRGRKR